MPENYDLRFQTRCARSDRSLRWPSFAFAVNPSHARSAARLIPHLSEESAREACRSMHLLLTPCN